MPKTILIDPVTRIEGHAKITVQLGDDGAVARTRFHVTEFRGFEAFCQGRPFHEMPALTARTCGICPVSHVLTGAKAGDAILGVAPPPAARQLRRLMNLGQILQSHALSFFHLSAPDLLLGFDADPSQRHIFHLIDAQPDIARRGIRMRRFGQEVIAALGGRKVHPAWAVPGGVLGSIDPTMRAKLLSEVDTIVADAQWAWAQYLPLATRHRDEVAAFGEFPSLFLALAGQDGLWEHHDGLLRFIDEQGRPVGPDFAAEDYLAVIGEVADADTYLKSPYHLGRQGDAPVEGDAPGTYRVGPLARINIAERMGTPSADMALAAFRSAFGRVPLGSFHYHGARLIEILTCAEQIRDLLADPELGEGALRAEAGVNALRGVGVSEAPRGTLLHDYRVDEHGVIRGLRMVIATGHNNLAMNRTVDQIAKAFIGRVKAPEGAPLKTEGAPLETEGALRISEGVLNRIEAGIRAFDPCLSCSTHAVGQMPLLLVVENAAGETLRTLTR